MLYAFGRLFSVAFEFIVRIFLIFPQLQCSHCAIIINKKYPHNNLQNQLDLIYRTSLKLFLKAVHHIHRRAGLCIDNHKLHIGAHRAVMVYADAYHANLLVTLHNITLRDLNLA